MTGTVEAPPRVRHAAALLWASALLGVIQGIVGIAYTDPELIGLAGTVFAIGLALTAAYGLVIYFASQRRNWARYLLLLWVVAGTAFYLAFPSVQPEAWWYVAALTVGTACEVLALYWLFTGAAAQWYQQGVAS